MFDGVGYIEADFLVLELLVDDEGEADVEEDLVVEGEAEQGADELVLDGHFEGLAVEPEDAVVHLHDEHAVVEVEELLDEQLEELPLDSAVVDALLALELDLERHLQGHLGVVQLRERGADEVVSPDLHVEVRQVVALQQRVQAQELRDLLVHPLPLLDLRLDVQDLRLVLRVQHPRPPAEREVVHLPVLLDEVPVLVVLLRRVVLLVNQSQVRVVKRRRRQSRHQEIRSKPLITQFNTIEIFRGNPAAEPGRACLQWPATHSPRSPPTSPSSSSEANPLYSPANPSTAGSTSSTILFSIPSPSKISFAQTPLSIKCDRRSCQSARLSVQSSIDMGFEFSFC